MAVDNGYGPHGEPKFKDTGSPDIGVDPTAVAAYAALVGNRIVGTATDRNANVVPGTSVAVWEGLEWYDTTDKRVYIYTGSTNGWQTIRFHFEFTSTDGMVDGSVRYPQWTADTGNTIDPVGSTVVVWNNGNSTPSGVQFNAVGIYAITATAVLAANVTSGTAVFQLQTGSTLEGVTTSGTGNQNFQVGIPNYRVTATGQQLRILMLKTNGSNAANTFKLRIDRIA